MADLISRLAALDALEKEKPTPFVDKDGSIDPFGVGRQNQWYRDGMAIINLPSAQSVTNDGEWEIVYDEDCDGGGKYICGNCRHAFSFGAYFELCRFDYCPNCGARMNGWKKSGAKG